MNPRAVSLSASLSACAVAATLVLCATTAGAKTSDRNQTMNVSADSSDCGMDDAKPCLLTGNVRIAQGTLDINAARADVRRANGEIATVKLTGGPVTLKQQNDGGGWVNATASQIDYDLPKNTVVLTGNAKIDQPGRGSISGERIIYNMRTSQVQSGAAAGGSGGRVNMTFEPKDKTPAAAPDKTGTKPAASDDELPAQDTPAQGTDEQN